VSWPEPEPPALRAGLRRDDEEEEGHDGDADAERLADEEAEQDEVDDELDRRRPEHVDHRRNHQHHLRVDGHQRLDLAGRRLVHA